MTELPKFEVYFYFCVWTSGVFISLYRLFLIGQVFDHRDHDQYHYEDFKKGWNFLGGRFQDQADSEWNTWTSLAVKSFPFLLLNLLGAEFIKLRKIFHLLPIWYFGITISFLTVYFNTILMLWYITQTLIYSVIIHLKSYVLVWVVSFVIIHFFKPGVWFAKNEEDHYVVMVSSSWMVLRCISYSVDKLKEKRTCALKISDILVLLAYSFYLPTMFCGPFISFCYFDEGIETKCTKWNLKKLISTCKKFFKCILWFFFTIFALHFIYVNAILLRPDFVRHLLDWELAGLGIAMGHFFHLKYIVFYGIPCAWADAEGFTTPKLPCCVSRVHLYSYMWRRFDHGLYQFLIKSLKIAAAAAGAVGMPSMKAVQKYGNPNSKNFYLSLLFKYIYIPIISKVKGKDIVQRIAASIVCFTFIFIWHGEQDYVFFWVLFNYIAVTIELIVKQISNLTPLRNFLDQSFSPQNQMRIACLLSAPLHCFSMISNYFFIGNGVEIGFIYLNRILHGSFRSKLTVLFFLYGAGQSSVATQKWETKNI